jgi:Fe2+ or Zn2+ uptake regulation protein
MAESVSTSWNGNRSMQAFESKVAEVRKALEPLSDVGIVERVRASGAGGYVDNETGRLDGKVTITVTVAGRSSEKHYPEIQRLVEQAGTTGVSLRFEPSEA